MTVNFIGKAERIRLKLFPEEEPSGVYFPVKTIYEFIDRWEYNPQAFKLWILKGWKVE